jgi:homogentisate 1,2-dioxygenase
MRYASLGEIPVKRHVQVRRNGDGSPLLVEEVMGYEGFSGNESILLHLQSPCRLDDVGEFRPIEREEWVPNAHVHRLADANLVEPGGDPVSARRLLMWNGDVEVAVCKPTSDLGDGFYRNGEGDEVLYVHRGHGVLRTMFGRVPFRERDYVVIPRGTTHAFELPEGEEQFWMCFHTPGELETPARYRNRYGQLLEHAPFSQRDFHPPGELETYDESGSFPVTVRVRDGFQEYVLGRLRLALHVQRGRLRAAGRALPPAAAGPPDLPGPQLRDLHVRAADARLGPRGGHAALPPLEHPVRGGHVLRGGRLRGAQGR